MAAIHRFEDIYLPFNIREWGELDNQCLYDCW